MTMERRLEDMDGRGRNEIGSLFPRPPTELAALRGGLEISPYSTSTSVCISSPPRGGDVAGLRGGLGGLELHPAAVTTACGGMAQSSRPAHPSSSLAARRILHRADSGRSPSQSPASRRSSACSRSGRPPAAARSCRAIASSQTTPATTLFRHPPQYLPA